MSYFALASASSLPLQDTSSRQPIMCLKELKNSQKYDVLLFFTGAVQQYWISLHAFFPPFLRGRSETHTSRFRSVEMKRFVRRAAGDSYQQKAKNSLPGCRKKHSDSLLNIHHAAFREREREENLQVPAGSRRCGVGVQTGEEAVGVSPPERTR